MPFTDSFCPVSATLISLPKNQNTMNRFYSSILLPVVLLLSSHSQQASAGPVEYPGYKLIEKRFVKELNADCYYLEHIKSGARIFKIATNDPNKTFGVGFKTICESDNGIMHILEHSVLNGSKKFPVKSPFEIMGKGSLNTFINAFTGKDITYYPAASMNEKDYFNLMNVYYDAVFNPNFLNDSRVLDQEGWHLEMKDKDSPLVYKGIVYNEMKGAFSSPEREMRYQIFKKLFAGNGYGFESGGYPPAIPTLTQESFIKYYKNYYHPENACIYFYGDEPLAKELEFIDREYLSKYNRINWRAKIEDNKPFAARQEMNAYYSVMEGAPTEKQTFLTLNIVTGKSSDQTLSWALDVITEVLINQESGPIRLALEKAGIGSDVYATVTNLNQNILQIVVKKAEASQKTEFISIVESELKKAMEKGLDMEEVQGVINRWEFQLSEGADANKGITYFSQCQPQWFYSDNPFKGLEYEKALNDLKKAIKEKFLEQTIGKYLLNNPYSLICTMEPKPGLDKERNAKEEKELEKIKSAMSPSEIEAVVKKTEELIAYQNSEDSPEALKTIPMLSLSDIDTKAPFYSATSLKIGNTSVLHYKEFTNDILYLSLYFDVRTVPQDKIPYISLLTNILGSIDTKKHSYSELNKLLNINTGGFYTTTRNFLEKQEDKALLPKFTVVAKAKTSKSDKMLELVNEIILESNYSDTARLHSVLTRHLSGLESSMKNNGFSVAQNRLPSYYTQTGVFNELMNGLEYYWFVSGLLKNFNSKGMEIAKKLEKTAALIFNHANLVAGLSCTSADLDKSKSLLDKYFREIPDTKIPVQKWNLTPKVRNEGIMTASKVQYVLEGYNFKQLGYKWNGNMRLLNKIISSDWLTNQVRVIGGAYGGFSSIQPNGNITFMSYRDPNLKETLDNYANTVGYLEKFDPDEPTFTRFIIGTIAGMDRPMTVVQRGEQAFSNFFSLRTAEEAQLERNAVLKATPADIKAYSKMIGDIVAKRSFCIYGNKEKINGQKDLFGELITIEKN